MSREVNIDLNKLQNLACPECGLFHFQKIYNLKVIPRLMVGAPQDGLAAIEQHQCLNCDYIIKPSDLKVTVHINGK